MITDERLQQLRQILKEDYQIELTEKDLKSFAENLKGLYAQLIQAMRGKENKFNLVFNENKNEKQCKSNQITA